jgi:uncharacterized protein
MSLILLLLMSFAAAFASETNHSIKVQGKCEIKISPDRGSVVLTAENQEIEQKSAVKKTTDQINALKEKVNKLKLPEQELRNTHYNVWPVREYEKNRYVNKGTRASLGLEVVTSDIARLGEVMAAAAEAGIQNVGTLQTFLSPAKSRQEYLRCLDVAAEDARAKAEQLARKLNFKLGPVIGIDETPKQDSMPVPVMGRSMVESFSKSMEPTQIEAGEQVFAATIKVTFGIR